MAFGIEGAGTLQAVLERVPIDRFPRDRASVTRAVEDFDYELDEALCAKLVARSRHGGREIVAHMPFGRPRQPYTVVADGREIEIHFREGHGGHIARFAHSVFDLMEGGVARGAIDEWPNVGFAFTNREPCLGLSAIRLGDEAYLQYRGELPESWYRVTPFTVTVDQNFDVVATIVAVGSLFSRRYHMKLHRPVSCLTVGLLMASNNGVTFRRS